MIEPWWRKEIITNPNTQQEEELPKWVFDTDKETDDKGYHKKLANGNVYVMPTSGKHGGDIATLLNYCAKGDHTAYVTVLMWPQSATEEPHRAEYKNLISRSGAYEFLKKKGEAPHCTPNSSVPGI